MNLSIWTDELRNSAVKDCKVQYISKSPVCVCRAGGGDWSSRKKGILSLYCFSISNTATEIAAFVSGQLQRDFFNCHIELRIVIVDGNEWIILNSFAQQNICLSSHFYPCLTATSTTRDLHSHSRWIFDFFVLLSSFVDNHNRHFKWQRN